MNLEANKITSSDLANKGVVGLPDTPNLSTLVMQQKFDEIAKDVIVPKYNALIDDLDESIAPIVSENPQAGETFIYDADAETFKNGMYFTELSKLKDVNVGGVTNKQYLVYDEEREVWYPESASGSIETISACEDTSIVSPQTNDVLKWNGSKWANTPEDRGLLANINIASEEGATITATAPSGATITATDKGSGNFLVEADEYGTWSLTGTKNGETVTATVSVDAVKEYSVSLTFMAATIVVTYPTGATVTCSKDTEEYTATASPYTFTVHETGTWVITGTRGGITETQNVAITENGQSESVTLTIVPDGDSATPTDTVQTLLKCADIWDKDYTSISEVIADDATMLKVLTSNNAIDYLVRSTTFASAIVADEDAMAMIGSYDYASDTLTANSTWLTAILGSAYVDSVENISTPTMTSNTTPSGEASAKTTAGASYPAWKAFDKDTSTLWASATNPSDDYLRYKFASAKKINAVKIKTVYSGSLRLKTLSIKASNDSFSTSTTLMETTTLTNQNVEDYIYLVSPTDAYLAYGIENLSTYQSDVEIKELNFYGREKGGVQSWLKAGGITDKSYTTLAEVLADTTTLSALLSSNNSAYDYLVTATALADGITANANAMSYIGLDNYGANKLIADATWVNAICNSTYMESVLNVKVPIMTDNTTPSGTASASSEGGGQEAYHAFDGTSSIWNSTSASAPVWVGYTFPSNTKVYLAEIQFASYASSSTVKIQGGSSNTDISESTTISGTTKTKMPITAPSDTYAFYRAYISEQSKSSSYAGVCQFLQFYGRADI